MMLSADDWLIATAVFAILGAVGTLFAFQTGRQNVGHRLAVVGMFGGFVSAAIVAAMLMQGSETGLSVVRSSLWNWFEFSRPHSLQIGFGLEATWINSSLVSLCGLIGIIALLSAKFRKQPPFSDGVVLATSFLYAGGVVFVLSPDLAQALLGWAVVSMSSGILIHLSRAQGASHRIDTQVRSLSTMESRAKGNLDFGANHVLHVIATSLNVLERFVASVWRTLTMHWPAAVVEQLELIESTSLSFRLAATMLCAFAVLLTWLMVSV